VVGSAVPARSGHGASGTQAAAGGAARRRTLMGSVNDGVAVASIVASVTVIWPSQTPMAKGKVNSESMVQINDWPRSLRACARRGAESGSRRATAAACGAARRGAHGSVAVSAVPTSVPTEERSTTVRVEQAPVLMRGASFTSLTATRTTHVAFHTVWVLRRASCAGSKQRRE